MDTSKQMPDLMTAAPAADGSRRILAHLEHGPRAASRPARAHAWAIDGWTVGLIVLLLTMCGIAWLMHAETITPVTFKSHRAPAPVVPPAASRTAPTEHVAGAANAEQQPAAIVNIAQAPPSASANPAPPAGMVHAASDKVVPKIVTAAPRAKAAPAVISGDKPAPASDTDVTLLTALVAHAGKPASVAVERSRDVVERHDGDKTADLLARCKQLGLMEGMLCRSRICSGSWESDAACRVPAQQ
ncbi:MAG: hypothetical protein ABW069_13690 [Duganella sp.]